MKESTYDLRFAKITNNANDKKDNNRTLAIKVGGNIPMLAGNYMNNIISDDGRDYGVVGTIETDSAATDSDIKNFLVGMDIDMDDRYVYLGIAQSILSKLYVTFYYDRMFNDILVIPNMNNLGTEDNYVDFYENSTVTVQAYSVGRGMFSEKPLCDFITPLIQDDKDGILEPSKFDKTKTLLVSSFGLGINSLSNGLGLNIPTSDNNVGGDNNTTRVNVKKAAPVQYVSFPLNADIYKENPFLATYNVLQQFHGELSFDYVGKKKIDRIVIPISF